MTPRLKPLHRQVVVITGASSGIGLATARIASRRGARLVVAARSRNALDELVRELRGRRREAVAVVADVSRAEDVDRIAAEATEAFGGFDTWINNAAVSVYGPCLEVSLSDIRRVLETNVLGVVHGSRTACAHLRYRGGALINVGSIVADRAVPLQGIYSASKEAIQGWTEALRTELAHERAPISVTLIKPAAIDTPYALHAGNYLEDQPTHVPPVYTPRAVARAILYAATHPVRDLYVGSAGRLLWALNTVAPRVVDHLMARLMIRWTHSGRPRSSHPTLYEPGEDLRERGDYHGVVRPSVYSFLGRHRLMAGAVALAVPLAARAIGGARNHSRGAPELASSGTSDPWSPEASRRPNARESADRAAQ